MAGFVLVHNRHRPCRSARRLSHHPRRRRSRAPKSASNRSMPKPTHCCRPTVTTVHRRTRTRIPMRHRSVVDQRWTAASQTPSLFIRSTALLSGILSCHPV